MRRRSFLKTLAHGGLVVGTVWGWVGTRALPRRVTEAVRAKRYPGPVVPLDESEARKAGRWAG